MADLSGVTVTDTREVRADVANAPLLYTPTGKNPIEPRFIWIRYHRGGGTGPDGHISVEVNGRRHGDPRGPVITRRPRDIWSIEWIAALVDQHMPETTEAATPHPDHDCPAGCGRQVPYELYACPRHWAQLPEDLREAVRNATGFADRSQAMRAARLWFEYNSTGAES